MRHGAFSLLMLALLLGPLATEAKEKKMPVPDWAAAAAKTPTPANVGNAASVVLFDEYVETIDAQGRAVEREREAVRILQPQARKEGCGVRYDVDEKINFFHEWTIAADGKTYQAMDTDFEVEGDQSQSVMLSSAKRRIVHPPAGDVGATILCESEEVMAPWKQEMLWWIQSSGAPVVLQALEIDLPPGMNFAESWHRYAPVKPVEVAPNHWRWEIKDMPQLDLRNVRSRPDLNTLLARASVTWGEKAVKGNLDERWKAIAKWSEDLQAHRADPSPEISAKVQELIAPTKDYFDKLVAVTEYIQKNVQYFIVERGIGGFQSHPASEIYRKHYGDCKDKTTLLISMLQGTGIQAHYLAVDSSRGFVDRNAPSMFGDHMITAIEIPDTVQDARLQAVVKQKNGKRVLIFDPTDERTPVGNLRSDLQGSNGLLYAGADSELLELPVLAPESNGTAMTGSFQLAADGTLSGSVDTSHNGTEGADLRYFLKFTDEKERRIYWEKIVARDLPGVLLEDFQFVQPASLQKPVEFHYKIKVSGYSHQAGPLLLVRPRVVGEHGVAIEDKPRTMPIDLSATGRWHDSFDIALPEGYQVDELPDPVSLDMGFASYTSKVSAKENKVHYERDYRVREVEISADRAQDLRRFETAVHADEDGAVVLKKK